MFFTFLFRDLCFNSCGLKRKMRTVFSKSVGLGERAWASAHRGKWGQLTPLEKWVKI